MRITTFDRRTRTIQFYCDAPQHRASQEGAGAACGGGAASHVLAAIGATPSSAASTIRLSPGRQTTEKDVDQAAQHVIEAVNLLRARL